MCVSLELCAWEQRLMECWVTLGPLLRRSWKLAGCAFGFYVQVYVGVKPFLMPLGRFVRCFEFRRPLLSLLDRCWPASMCFRGTH